MVLSVSELSVVGWPPCLHHNVLTLPVELQAKVTYPVVIRLTIQQVTPIVLHFVLLSECGWMNK